jgi:hypothetical protein
MQFIKKCGIYSWELSIVSSGSSSLCCKKVLNKKLSFDFIKNKRICKSENKAF